MSPPRLKARGGAGSKISLPPPSISPPLTCKILQERRALRKLFGPPDLADHPRKPSSSLPARRVPINPKEMARQKNVSAVARLTIAPSNKQVPGGPFKKPFYGGHGFSSSVMPCRANGSVAKAFCAAAQVKRHPNVDVGSIRTGKPGAAHARLSKALACCTAQVKTRKNHLKTNTHKHTDYEKEAQQNCNLTSTYKAVKGGLLSNDFDMQVSYDVKSNQDDGENHVKLEEEAPIRHGQLLPSIFEANYDKNQVSQPSSYFKMVRDLTCENKDGGKHLSAHKQSPRCSGSGAMFDTCADVDVCRHALHSNANLREIDRSRDVCKISGNPDNQAIIDCSRGDVDDCQNAPQTHASPQESGDTDRSVDGIQMPRIHGNHAVCDSCSSDVLNGIFTSQARASLQEFDGSDSSGNAGQKLQNGDDGIFDYSCKFTSHWYARLQDCNDAQSSRNASKKPRSGDEEAIFSPRSHGNEAIFDSFHVDDDACKFVSQVNASLHESNDTRSRGNASKKPRSCHKQAVFESPWRDVDACEFSSHSYADCQELDDIDNAGMNKCDQNSMQKNLGIQVTLSDIDNAVESGKDTKLSNTLQEKLALFEGTMSHIVANLKKTSDQLDAKIYDNVVLLSCIQSKLSSIEGLVVKMEAFNCEDLKC